MRPLPQRRTSWLLLALLVPAGLLNLGVGRAETPTRPVEVGASSPSTYRAPGLPVRLELPAIGVVTPLVHLGLTAAGALQVPGPGPHADQAGWYRGSPRPGAPGPAVIAGHVDSARNGPSVFYRLEQLAPGDLAIVTAEDGVRRRFVVDAVRSFPKDRFPTLLVYGNTALPELRLITCGGPFDARTGHYLDNTVVSAHLVVDGTPRRTRLL